MDFCKAVLRPKEAMRDSRISFLTGLVGCLIVALPVPVEARQPRLKITHHGQRGGGTIQVNVYIDSAIALGAYTLELEFDTTILELLDIEGGAGEHSAAPITNRALFPSGKVRFAAFQTQRNDLPSGKRHVATLEFRPRVSRANTRIHLRPVVVADTLGSTYSLAPRPRTLRIRAR